MKWDCPELRQGKGLIEQKLTGDKRFAANNTIKQGNHPDRDFDTRRNSGRPAGRMFSISDEHYNTDLNTETKDNYDVILGIDWLGENGA
ncbi:unnamed protein product [Amaranthus hypochondriacus]